MCSVTLFGLNKRLVAMCLLFAPVMADAQSLTIKCESEDEGILSVTLPSEKSANSRQFFFDGEIGTMRNGEITVRAYVSAVRKPGRFDYELAQVLVISKEGATLGAAVRRVMTLTQRPLGLEVTGPGIDPEGIQCTILPKLKS